MKRLLIIGGGLAGSEAAHQAASMGVEVDLFEMRPQQSTPAHKTDRLAELVCSNSFRSASMENASGLLKEEMRRMGSLILEAADACPVPAGQALAVDREVFSAQVTEAILREPRIRLIREEVTALDPGQLTIVATGPLTSQRLSRELSKLTRDKYLYFYDAISPIVTGESIRKEATFFASRYGKGEDDYLNCPMNREQYEEFIGLLLEAEKVPLHDFEKAIFFEGCLPIEEMAARGRETLAFGPLKPVGLAHPVTGETFCAVVQLRRENLTGEYYSMVGFQTRLRYPEQRRVLRTIPGLEEAQFLRYGSLHRNTFLNAPKLLLPTLQLRRAPHIFIAGQLTGVEGYLESAATGLLAGLHAASLIRGEPMRLPPDTTALGALIGYLTRSSPKGFQPMNINFGLFPPVQGRASRKRRNQLMVMRALHDLEGWREKVRAA
ncbi:MAG: methylenetetrahydrofolate--tRNA-(uracil(54)-C(5))-methyltransferase (FADH(2)-oxidizing) TrmFO [Nitrospinota bacterium]